MSIVILFILAIFLQFSGLEVDLRKIEKLLINNNKRNMNLTQVTNPARKGEKNQKGKMRSAIEVP